jgi:hypothetical protein
VGEWGGGDTEGEAGLRLVVATWRSVQTDQAEAIAAITDYVAELDATEDEDERNDILSDGLEVWVSGLPWSLSLEDDGWQARPVHESEDDPGTVEDDGTDGEPRRIGGPDLAPETIIELLQVAERGGEDDDEADLDDE